MLDINRGMRSSLNETDTEHEPYLPGTQFVNVTHNAYTLTCAINRKGNTAQTQGQILYSLVFWKYLTCLLYAFCLVAPG